MSKVVVNGSLIPSVKNAPLDLRTRINTIAEVESIQVPFVGMIFYVIDEEKFYVVKSLKGSKIGNIDLPDTTVDVFEPLIKVEVDNVEIDLSAYATIEKVEELIAAIEHPQYDDSEIKERIEVLETINLETKPYIDKNGMLVLCGCPAVARGVGEEVHVIVRFFNNAEDKFVFTKEEFAKLRICMGYGAEGVGTKRNIMETTLEMYDIDRAFIIDGGSQITGEVGTVNIIAERVNYIDGIQGARAMNGGERNIVHNFNIKVTDVKLIDTLYGGGNGYSVVWNSNIEVNGDTEINYLIAGGSNGYTNKSRIVMNGGHAKIMQGVNRGILNRAELILNGGIVDNFYAAGDASDSSVNGVQHESYIELNGGQVNKFNKGTSNSVEYDGEIKGHIIDCVVVEGDVSMLEVVVEEEEPQLDLSEFAKVEYVDAQIAAIELKEGPQGEQGPQGERGEQGPEGPMGPQGEQGIQGEKGETGAQGPQGIQGEKGDTGAQGPVGPQGEQGPVGKNGKDFTYDMFTEEQLAALKGANGQDGAPGADGQPGKDGEQGPQGDQGVSVVKVEIVENHLMVTLSDDQVLDAGEMPAGQGGGTVNPEIEKELAETKQQLLDLTYGVEYEWIYFCEQDEELNSIGFNRETAPKFYEEIDEAINAGDEAFEEFIINMYEQDIYRMYVLRIVSEHKYANRYELLPLIDNPHHSRSAFLAKWNATSPVEAWNVDIENDVNGFEFIGGFPTSPLVLAFLKIKK